MVSHHKLPQSVRYQARDGSDLYYRHYHTETTTNQIVILLHGIAEDSKYLYPLASYLSEQRLADVITPDLRGYGEYPIKRGDLDYIGQLEDDLADLIDCIKRQHAESKVILAGHSAGGGTAIRFAASKYAKKVDKYLLLSPFIHYQSPTMKKSDDDNDPSSVNVTRLISLILLNSVGYKRRNHLPVITRNKPKEARHGSETLTLSYRLFMSRIPKNYKKALANLPDDTLTLIGNQDEEFDHTQFQPLYAPYNRSKVYVIEQADHDGILSSQKAWKKIREWL